MTTRSVLGGAALMLVGIVLGAVAGTSEPVFSDVVPSTPLSTADNEARRPIGLPPVGRYRMESSNNELYMNDTETGELWVLANKQRWHRLVAGPKLAAEAQPTTKRETTVEKKGE